MRFTRSTSSFGFFDGGVSRLLGQDQGAAQRIVGLTGGRGQLLGVHRPFSRLAQLVLQRLDAGRHPLEELIDVLGVISPELLPELHLAKSLRREVHTGNGTAARPLDRGGSPLRCGC